MEIVDDPPVVELNEELSLRRDDAEEELATTEEEEEEVDEEEGWPVTAVGDGTEIVGF